MAFYSGVELRLDNSINERELYYVTIRQASKGQQIFILGLFLVRSPLLEKCQLVSFPSLSNMLKFSEFFYLVGGKY